ncbi:MAG: hypothetical protein LBN92_03030, partial [Treponema sp.]|nr:hypothetical protein [Treponema sp.]
MNKVKLIAAVIGILAFAACSGVGPGGFTPGDSGAVPGNLTGVVLIKGSPIPGVSLNADVDFLDGSGNVSWQWLRGGEPVGGGTGSSYTLTAADLGKVITVRVSRAGKSGSVVSAPHGPVISLAEGQISLPGGIAISDTVNGPLGTTAPSPAGTLAGHLSWLKANARAGFSYTI